MDGGLGRRVVVWGATGSGKTTLAERLSAALGLGMVDLDAIRHERGWDSTPWNEFRDRLAATLDGSPRGWCCAGSYSRISDVYLSRADTLIWLNLPWRVSFWRLLRRTVSRAWTREPLYSPEGPTESWRLSFLSRQSILWWSISHYRTHVSNTRQRIAGLPPGVRVVVLRSAAEVQSFLAAVERTATGTPAGAAADTDAG